MTGMTGNSVYGLFGKTKSAEWNRYFSGFSAIRSEEIKSPYIIWHTEKRESRGIFDYLFYLSLSIFKIDCIWATSSGCSVATLLVS